MNLGFGDLVIGTRRQHGPARGFDVSVVVSLGLPTAASTVIDHGYDLFVQLPWSRAFDANWTAAGMLSVYWPRQNGRRNVTGEATFLVDRQLMKKVGCFCRVRGRLHGERRAAASVALRHKLQDRVRKQQIDVHCGIGLASAAVDHFIGVGYSFRLGAVHR
jgi:hypothetical protein